MSDPPVPPATKASSGPILVATDGTTAGEAAFRAAVLIAAKLSSSVHVMVVVEPLPVLVPDRAKELQKFAEELNAPAAARVEHVILSGAPSRAVLELAEENDADLIVAGTRGTGRMQRLLLGSVATRLMRHSTRPLLIVPDSAVQD